MPLPALTFDDPRHSALAARQVTLFQSDPSIETCQLIHCAVIPPSAKPTTRTTLATSHQADQCYASRSPFYPDESHESCCQAATSSDESRDQSCQRHETRQELLSRLQGSYFIRSSSILQC